MENITKTGNHLDGILAKLIKPENANQFSGFVQENIEEIERKAGKSA